MPTYLHSGSGGDLIYSLPTFQALGGGDLFIGIGNLKNVDLKWGYKGTTPYHIDRFTEEDYLFYQPLLKVQKGVLTVNKWYPENKLCDVELDDFRRDFGRKWSCNYIASYHQSFGIRPKAEDLQNPWLVSTTPNRVAPIIITRTARYRGEEPKATENWQKLNKEHNFLKNAAFIGTRDEHNNFMEKTLIRVVRHQVKDALDMANIINSADLFIGNQTLTLAIAFGFRKPCIVEARPDIPLLYNECFFDRDNCKYF